MKMVKSLALCACALMLAGCGKEDKPLVIHDDVNIWEMKMNQNDSADTSQSEETIQSDAIIVEFPESSTNKNAQYSSDNSNDNSFNSVNVLPHDEQDTSTEPISNNVLIPIESFVHKPDTGETAVKIQDNYYPWKEIYAEIGTKYTFDIEKCHFEDYDCIYDVITNERWLCVNGELPSEIATSWALQGKTLGLGFNRTLPLWYNSTNGQIIFWGFYDEESGYVHSYAGITEFNAFSTYYIPGQPYLYAQGNWCIVDNSAIKTLTKSPVPDTSSLILLTDYESAEVQIVFQ